MLKAFANIFKVEELRNRVLFTAGIIILVRLAANIPCPGVDVAALDNYIKDLTKDGGGGMLGMFDMFSGGALQQFAIATLGIMPYISASIIMQLLVPVLPSLGKMVREGESGRQKISQYTRYLTVVICIVQGAVAAMAMENPGRIGLKTPAMSLVTTPGTFFVIMTVIILTCSTMILMWLGEKITEKGIGNGISLIITVNIVDRFPSAISALYELAVSGGGVSDSRFRLVHLFILILVFFAVTAFTIMLTQGQRRVPIQMARATSSGKIRAGSTYIPLKVNFSGVMPIIFAGAVLMVPGVLLRWIPIESVRAFSVYFDHGSTSYMFIYGFMIMIFSFFWVANQFNPIQISDNLKKEGAYIPGIRPGQPTADFLDGTMTKITLAGSILLAALSIFPMLLYQNFKLPYLISSFFGGTSLLIIVGVLLDTLSQMESHLTMRNYDGFLKSGRLRSRKG